jgi:nucleoside 2-deoxyribosyltransferase
MVREVLISCPGDVADDAQHVAATIRQWSTTYGRSFATVVLPLSWTLDAAAEYGRRPQASLNEQLVDRADAVIALIWHRLGTPTGEAESGTIEEIRHAVKTGKSAALLVCDRSPNSLSEVSPTELERRDDFLESIRSECLYLVYRDDAELRRHVENVLTRLVTEDQQLALVTNAAFAAPVHGAVVWPRVETKEKVETDSKGRVRTRRSWFLVLENAGDAPALNVRFRIEPEEGDEEEGVPRVINEDRPLEVLAPHGVASYPMVVSMATGPQARCIVTWEDDAGPHEQVATIRIT